MCVAARFIPIPRPSEWRVDFHDPVKIPREYSVFSLLPLVRFVARLVAGKYARRFRVTRFFFILFQPTGGAQRREYATDKVTGVGGGVVERKSESEVKSTKTVVGPIPRAITQSDSR